MKPRLLVLEVWEGPHQCMKMEGGIKRATLFFCSCWLIWKQRNALVFGGSVVPARILAERIVQEGELCSKYFSGDIGVTITHERT